MRCLVRLIDFVKADKWGPRPCRRTASSRVIIKTTPKKRGNEGKMELGGSQHINLYALIKRRSYESPVRLPLMADILSHLDGDKSGGGKRNLIIIRRPCRCVECAECRSRLWSRGGQRGGAVLQASRCFAAPGLLFSSSGLLFSSSVMELAALRVAVLGSALSGSRLRNRVFATMRASTRRA